MTTTTTRSSKKSKRKKRKFLTLGPQVAKWIETNLVHAEGDYYGQPFRFRDFQRRMLYKMYRLRADGSRWYDRVLIGLPKGEGKSEFAAAVADAELWGPVAFGGWDENGDPIGIRRTSPDIPVAAASYDQANIVFGAARTMIEQGVLGPVFDCFDKEVQPKEGPGILRRVAAEAGTNDGYRPTFFVADELHEWVGRKERVYLVLSNNRAKRADAWELAITTAGWDPTSLLGRMYQYGKKVASGAVKDPRFLFIWYEPSRDYDLDDPEELEAAIRECSPAVGDFQSLENVVQKYHTMAEHEFRRYFLNQWTRAPERWIDVGDWKGCEGEREVTDDEPITLGFDGSYNRDATALWGCTVEDPHLFRVGLWERPEGIEDWRVDMDEVADVIRDVCAKRNVLLLGVDDSFGRIWAPVMETLEAEGIEVVEWPTRSPSRMAPACSALWGAVKDGRLSHDGDEDLTRHIANCVTKTDRFGTRIVKEYHDSPNRIDAAVAVVIAYDLATRKKGATVSWQLL